jgi:acyl dehydratase
MTTQTTFEALPTLAGRELGQGEWQQVTQDQVNQFADVTGDHQWIHVDVERATRGPFGAPIAHGFLTLSLLPSLTRGLLTVEGVKMGVNYGLNRVRFPSPVAVGSRIRASVKNVSVEPVQGGVQIINQVTVEIEGKDKPACVAETLSRVYF